MNITIDNYEEYFLLLADNELNQAEEAVVKKFAAQHPHLLEELKLLFSCRLDASDMPSFPKETLIRPTIWNVENPAPLHTQMLSLLDNELSHAEEQQLKEQIAASPVLQTEWSTLQKAKLPADAVFYPDKKDLYRQHQIRPMVWMRRAAAAAAIVFLTWMLWPAATNNGPLTSVVAVVPESNQPVPVSVQPNPADDRHTAIAKQETVITSPAVAAVTKQPLKKLVQTRSSTNAIAASGKNGTFSEDDDAALSKQEAVMHGAEAVTMTEPENATLHNRSDLLTTLLKKEHTTVQTAHLMPENTMLLPDALQNTMAVNTAELIEQDEYVHIAGARIDKHKIRGLFRGISRSVTRTFSKSKMQPAETVVARSL